MKWLDYIYLELWKPAALRISVVYNEVAQIKSIIEFLITVAILLSVRGYKLPPRVMVLVCLLLFSLAIGIGEILIRKGAPQKSKHLNNKLNLEFMEILEWVRYQKRLKGYEPVHYEPDAKTAVIFPKTEQQKDRERMEQKAKDAGLDGVPVEDYL